MANPQQDTVHSRVNAWRTHSIHPRPSHRAPCDPPPRQIPHPIVPDRPESPGINEPPSQTPYPSYLRVKWYRSESVRSAAHFLHNRIYIPQSPTQNASRYDALFRPIITTAIEWSEVFGPFLTVRMWRWTGYFAPGGEGMVVEKFIGRHGLRDQKTREPVGMAYHLDKLRTGFPKLRPDMIKLPPNGTAKLNVPIHFGAGGGSIEVFLEANDTEVVDSRIWEGNLKSFRVAVRQAHLPLVLSCSLPAEETPFRPSDVPNQQAYDPQVLPIQALGIPQGAPQPVVANTYASRVPVHTPATIPPALQQTRASPPDTLLHTPAGGAEAPDMARVEIDVVGTFRLGAPGRGRR